VTTVLQPTNTAGRLLASNCFQCHGTGGVGGFENIRRGEASEIREYLSRPANSGIMAAHAQGYTSAQINAIITYLQQ
jgi:mono/diheme cytochrome c family protein